MREVAFIKQNKEKWLKVEQVVSGKVKKNPDDLSAIYINLVNDLSFSQTYYPKSKTTVYLNHLSAQIFQKIYKTRRIEKNRLFYFFKEDVPTIAYEYRRYLYYAVLFFIIFTSIGVISAHYDSSFVRLILGDNYVNMTLENIKKGNPIAVYDSGSMWGSTIAITYNNLMVGAKLYFYGFLAGIGTVIILLQNCIMLGSFQYFFYTQDVLGESARGIWIHGTFEIFSMIIEAMAGLILGSSLLFPKTYSRINSLKIGFKNSFKIFISTVPFTIVAGILEGFITRFALDIPVVINVIIILGMFLFISYYYIVYPRIVNKRNNKNAVL